MGATSCGTKLNSNKHAWWNLLSRCTLIYLIMLWVSIEHSAKSFYKQRNIILYRYVYIYIYRYIDIYL